MTEFLCAAQTWQVDLWDTAGQENFSKLRLSAYPGSNVIMVVSVQDLYLTLCTFSHAPLVLTPLCRERVRTLQSPRPLYLTRTPPIISYTFLPLLTALCAS